MIYVYVTDTKACKFVKLYGLQGKWLFLLRFPIRTSCRQSSMKLKHIVTCSVRKIH